jgi:hypothetical protein
VLALEAHEKAPRTMALATMALATALVMALATVVSGIPGDGTCDRSELRTYCRYKSSSETSGRVDGNVYKADCTSGLFLELFDCAGADLPEDGKGSVPCEKLPTTRFKDHANRPDIVDLQKLCKQNSDGQLGVGSCPVLRLDSINVANLRSKDLACGSMAAKELLLCSDDLLIQNAPPSTRTAVAWLRDTCNGTGASCLDIILERDNSIHTWISHGGVCAAEFRQVKPPDGWSCSAACAQTWSPFARQCGTTLKRYVADDNDGTATAAQKQHQAKFYSVIQNVSASCDLQNVTYRCVNNQCLPPMLPEAGGPEWNAMWSSAAVCEQNAREKSPLEDDSYCRSSGCTAGLFAINLFVLLMSFLALAIICDDFLGAYSVSVSAYIYYICAVRF